MLVVMKDKIMNAFYGSVLKWEHNNAGTSFCILCNEEFVVTYNYNEKVFCFVDGTGIFDSLPDLEIAIIRNFTMDQVKEEIEILQDVLHILEQYQ